ncbi:MAG: hypothetical protein J3R72DRAFT_422844 [Linnemannia gamsii]|nr:MAG: hypothetical protein J3R72DRAFT_422844 [Linnemannia gamsii]
MSASIPRYQKACLAADDLNSAVYLVGAASSEAGLLEVNYISLADGLSNLSSKRVAHQIDSQKWASGAEKACYAYKLPTEANAVVKVIQFGPGASFMSFFSHGAAGAVADPTFFASLQFQSSKLFSWIGSFTGTNINMFHMYAVTANPVSGSRWVGLRMGFVTANGDYSEALTNQYPSALEPLLSVGTYTPATTGTSQGYSVIFYKAGHGQVFATTSNDQATSNNTITLVALESAGDVIMNGIKITEDAFSVTVGETGYVLDRANDGISTVVYSITPKSSSSLSLVASKGPSIPFSTAMAGTAVKEKIIIYTTPEFGPGVINRFDPAKGTWSGNGLLSTTDPITPTPTLDPTSSTSSIGSIVGGIVGGIIIIAIAIFFFVRRRRQNTPKSTDSGAELVQLSSNVNKFDGNDQANVQCGQGYVAYEGGYPQPPSFVPPPPAINWGADTAYKVPTELKETPVSPTATSSSYVSPSSYRDSTLSPGSHESVQAKSVRYSVSHGPQYVPYSSVAASEARSPQAVNP